MTIAPMRVLLDTKFTLRAPHSGTGIYLQRLQAALADRDDVTVLAVANRRRRVPAVICVSDATRG